MLLGKLCKTTTFFKYRSLLPIQHPPLTAFAFSSVTFPINAPINNQHKIDESHILSQLSDIFPVSISNLPQYKLNIKASNNNQLGTKAADDFLPLEEKLRGVFLQKLRGRSSIHRALDSISVDVNLDVFAKVVNWGNLSGDSMVEFFNWAVEKSNIEKDISAYNIVIKALGRRKFFKSMMEVFGEMWEKGGVRPDVETLYIVMDSYICCGQVSKAVKIFRELERYGYKNDEETLSVMLKCLCRRSHVGTACSLFNKLKGELRYDSEMYNVVIGGWSKLGRVSEVEKYLKDMVDDGVESNSITYSYVIECFGRAGRVGDADRVFKFLEERGNDLSTVVYNAMIFNCISNGDINGALKYYKGMLSNDVETDMDTYMRILLYFLKDKRVADAIELFDEMLDQGLLPSTGNVTELIEPLCRYGPPHAALMIYKKARKAGCKISLKAYKLLLMRLSRFGKCGMLLSIWDELQESGYSSDTQVYDYIVNGLCNSGQLETAVMVMEESIQKGFFPGKIICSKLHNKLMDSNKVDTSYKLFLKIRSARVNENAQRYWRVKDISFSGFATSYMPKYELKGNELGNITMCSTIHTVHVNTDYMLLLLLFNWLVSRKHAWKFPFWLSRVRCKCRNKLIPSIGWSIPDI